MNALEILLERFWIIKEMDKQLYYQIKDAIPEFKEFIEEKLGYKLIANPYLLKLEKLPGKAEPWMGMQNFTEQLDYAFFCLLLMFLEDRGAGEQFVLSEVTEFVQAVCPGEEKIDWTLFRQRKSMVKALKLAEELGILQVDDEDGTSFMDSVETEVLYESTGLSRYVMRNFTGNVLNYASLEDIENGEWLDTDRDRGRVRRNRVYRRLFMAPAVYAEGADDPDYLYIKNFRSMLQKDIEEILEGRFHLHKNGAFVVLPAGKNYKCVFPENKTISDITLQVNQRIRELVEDGSLEKREDDVLLVSLVQLERIIEDCREKYRQGWSKEYREMTANRLYEEVMTYMQGFGMLEVNRPEKEVRIMPLAGKISGSYPSDFAMTSETKAGGN